MTELIVIARLGSHVENATSELCLDSIAQYYIVNNKQYYEVTG